MFGGNQPPAAPRSPKPEDVLFTVTRACLGVTNPQDGKRRTTTNQNKNYKHMEGTTPTHLFLSSYRHSCLFGSAVAKTLTGLIANTENHGRASQLHCTDWSHCQSGKSWVGKPALLPIRKIMGGQASSIVGMGGQASSNTRQASQLQSWVGKPALLLKRKIMGGPASSGGQASSNTRQASHLKHHACACDHQRA